MINKILALSINSAKRAGNIIREILESGNLAIVDKGTNDLQTEADRSAQKSIMYSLIKGFPDINIIGEEGNSDLTNIPDTWLETDYDKDVLLEKCPDSYINVNAEDITIWVDPLDGTSEYTQGYIEHVTVLVGIAVKNTAVAGVIHQPFFQNENGETGRTVWGMRELGIKGLTPKLAPSNEFIITTTRSHSTELVQRALESLNPTKIIRVGGAGYKVLQLLEGTAHAYVFASPGCKKWDTCAPEAILEAFGGKLTDIVGDHYQYNKSVKHSNFKGVIATGKNISHEDILKKLPSDIKEMLSKEI